MVRAIFFDLFDTLVHYDRSQLPQLRINGQVIHSTAGGLYPILAEAAPHIELKAFYDAVVWSWLEAEKIRDEEGREVSAPTRFAAIFHRLGLDPSSLPRGLPETLLEAHKRLFSRAAVFPEAYRQLLHRLAGRFRFAIVSNFDYAATVHLILERELITNYFDAVIVSDEIGWRKPTPVIFHEALRRLSLEPSEVLFVGDRAEIDVLGAKQVGMSAAWVNPNREPLPSGAPAPDIEIRNLTDLEQYLAA
ncbi:MAG TPA: HAD family hydrolase [Methylomirabilota bacterium]|nr:HAD family hydrolase [Methylomirabilota bacterium]